MSHITIVDNSHILIKHQQTSHILDVGFCLGPMMKIETKTMVNYSLRPAFESRHGEQSQHPHQHIVKVEIAVLPDPLFHHGVVHVAVFIDNKRPPETQTRGLRLTVHRLHVEEKRLIEKKKNTDLHSSGVCLASSVQL